MSGAAASRWRKKGETALAMEFLRSRQRGGHPLDVAEKLQLAEGFDDLDSARDAIVGSLEAFGRDQGAFVKTEEKNAMRQLRDILKERRGASQAAEPEEDDPWRQGLAPR